MIAIVSLWRYDCLDLRMHTDDIILAVASPRGRSLRGIVRMSGPGTIDLLGSCVRDEQGRPLQRRGIHRARLNSNNHSLPVLALLMPGPHSYTGEDSAELQMPGNPVLLERVIDTLIEAAALLHLHAHRAEGGEFTARAFLNGRISLTQAEGVAATITALSDAELRAAGMLRSGSLGKLAHKLADNLAAALALVEAGIDFTDQEDVVAITPADLHERLVHLEQQLRRQLDRAVGMEQLEAIPWVVLTGPPNAGKSTLFNALLGRERAVVSDVAGTTRDVLTEPLRISTEHGEAEVMLVDLAGTEHVDPLADAETLEPQMQRAAREASSRAELVLECTAADTGTAALRAARHEPGTAALRAAPYESRGSESRSTTIRVLTKCELSRETASEWNVTVSAHTGEGLDQLRSMIALHLADRAVSLAADVFALTPRHEAALRSAHANISDACELVAGMRDDRSLAEPELVAAAMRSALNDLAGLAGDITPDDVLGRVFATFCVGK